MTRETKVELRGFEPLTSSMPWKRATNCAIAPNKRQLYAGASKGGKSGRRAPGHSGPETAAQRQRLRHSGPSAAAQTQQYGHSNPSAAAQTQQPRGSHLKTTSAKVAGLPRCRYLGDVDSWGLIPQFVQGIEVPCFPQEDVYSHIAVVKQQPLRVLVAFDAG